MSGWPVEGHNVNYDLVMRTYRQMMREARDILVGDLEQAAAHYSSGRGAIPVLGLGSPTVHSHLRCPGSFLKPWSPSSPTV